MRYITGKLQFVYRCDIAFYICPIALLYRRGYIATSCDIGRRTKLSHAISDGCRRSDIASISSYRLRHRCHIAQISVLPAGFISDGPITQYRNKLNFYSFTTIVHDWGFQTASWNFFEAGHGKGARDAIGAAVKRQADQLVLSGIDLLDAMKLFNFLSCSQSATKFYFIDEASIVHINSLCHKSLRPISGTMKLHQIQSDETLKVAGEREARVTVEARVTMQISLKWFEILPVRNCREVRCLVSSLNMQFFLLSILGRPGDCNFFVFGV